MLRCLELMHRLSTVCQDPSMLQALLDKSLARIDDFGPTDAAKPFGCSLLANLGCNSIQPSAARGSHGFWQSVLEAVVECWCSSNIRRCAWRESLAGSRSASVETYG